MCLRRQQVAVEHSDDKQRSRTFIKWCDDADDWGDDADNWGVDPVVVKENSDAATESQAIEICASASAELENSDADNNVVVEPIVLPNTDILQLLDNRKELPLVSRSIRVIVNHLYFHEL